MHIFFVDRGLPVDVFVDVDADGGHCLWVSHRLVVWTAGQRQHCNLNVIAAECAAATDFWLMSVSTIHV